MFRDRGFSRDEREAAPEPVPQSRTGNCRARQGGRAAGSTPVPLGTQGGGRLTKATNKDKTKNNNTNANKNHNKIQEKNWNEYAEEPP